MNPTALSPEECFRLAKEHMAAQDFTVAAQLLQVAILKAPRDPTYQQALDELRSRRLMEVKAAAKAGKPMAAEFVLPTADAALERAEVDALRDIVQRFPDEPEHMLRLACHLDATGETQEALGFARRAQELAQDNLEAALLVMVLHKKLGNRSAEQRARQEVSLVSGGSLAAVRTSRANLKRMGLVRDPTLPLVPPKGQRLRAALLVALLLVTGAGYWFGRPAPPRAIDAAPFLTLEPFALAEERVDVGEVILGLTEHDWAGRALKERRDRLLALYDVARGLGYQRLLVKDGAGQMLGMAEDDKIYLRQVLGGAEEVLAELELEAPAPQEVALASEAAPAAPGEANAGAPPGGSGGDAPDGAPAAGAPAAGAPAAAPVRPGPAATAGAPTVSSALEQAPR